MRTDDGYIIQKCIDGDSTAFGLLVDKYSKSIYALAYSRIHNHHDAQDVTQEVFVKAYKDLRKLKRWDSFMGWLYRITVNLCKNWQRSESRRPDHEFAEDQDPIVLDNPSVSTYEQDKVYGSICEALDSLPEIYHEVLALYYLEDMSINDMSRFLGISSRTIDRRLNEARIILKEEMIAMMRTTYAQHKLSVGFTIHIVEILKQMKVQAMPKTSWLSYGLSAIVITVTLALGSGSYLFSNNLSGNKEYSASSSQMRLDKGLVHVSILDPKQAFIIGLQSNGDDGGLKQSNTQNILLSASQHKENEWKKAGDMPTTRRYPEASVVNGKIYVIGGYISGKPIPTVEEYNPDTGKWTKKVDMPTARVGSSTAVVNGRIYAIGGWIKTTDPATVCSSVEEYDQITGIWMKKADMPTPRANLSTSVVNGKIYAIGGQIQWSKKRSSSLDTSIVEEYDPMINTWTKKADMPTPRSSLSTSVVNGKIYAIGGSTLFELFQRVEEYDPSTDKWIKKMDMPTTRYGLSTCTVNRKILAIGGWSNTALSIVEEYDPILNKWIKKGNMRISRGGLTTAVVGGKVYAIGGIDFKHRTLSSMEKFDITSSQ